MPEPGLVSEVRAGQASPAAAAHHLEADTAVRVGIGGDGIRSLKVRREEVPDSNWGGFELISRVHSILELKGGVSWVLNCSAHR
jgi:hypothetical protein